MKNKLIILLIAVLLVLPFAFAHLGEEIEGIHDNEKKIALPENIQKVQDYNKEQAEFYLKKLSFLVAFLAGIIGILTPCSLAILPAFFAYSFKEKKEITKMTLLFFLGFAPVFIIFGILATFLGKTLAMFQQDNNIFVMVSGIVLIIFGLMILFGKGFSGINFNNKPKRTPLGIFLFGIFYAIGFTACMGPILVGILLIAGVLQSYAYATFLMLFYSLGLFVPLFLISMFFDKYNFSKFVGNLNKKLGFSISNLIAGILLISMGIIFLIYKGTYIFDYLGLGNITYNIYRLQESIVNIKYINIIGLSTLIIFLFLLWISLRKIGK